MQSLIPTLRSKRYRGHSLWKLPEEWGISNINHTVLSCKLSAALLLLCHPCGKAAVLTGSLSSFCGREVSWICFPSLVLLQRKQQRQRWSWKSFPKMVSILIDLFYSSLNLLSLYVHFHVSRLPYSFHHPLLTLIAEVLCVFFPSKKWLFSSLWACHHRFKRKNLLACFLFTLWHCPCAAAFCRCFLNRASDF